MASRDNKKSKWTKEEEEKLQIGSCFVIKFVEYFTTKLAEYEANIKPGYEVTKRSQIFEGVSGAIGGAAGAAAFLPFGLAPSKGFAIGRTLGEKGGNYSLNKFQHKAKAKSVVSLASRAVAQSSIIYNPAQQSRNLISILVNAGVEVFRIFEAQITIMLKESEHGERTAQKFALECVDRVMNYLATNNQETFSVESIAYAVIGGDSKPSGSSSKLTLGLAGKGKNFKIEKGEKAWNSCEMFENVAVIVHLKDDELDGVYSKDKDEASLKLFGARQLSSYEEEHFDQFTALDKNLKRYKKLEFEPLIKFDYAAEELLAEVAEECLAVFQNSNKLEEKLINLVGEIEKLTLGRNIEPPRSVSLKTFISLQVTTPGINNCYIGFENNYEAYIFEPEYKKFAHLNWRLIPGLANPQLYSIESQFYPGQYLRHQFWRLKLSPDDGSWLLKCDATWYIRPISEGQIRFESYNYPGNFIRHYNSEVWVANQSGKDKEQNNPHLFWEDATWKIVDALAK